MAFFLFKSGQKQCSHVGSSDLIAPAAVCVTEAEAALDWLPIAKRVQSTAQ